MKQPTVCYIGTLPLEQMGTNTRYRIKHVCGNNKYSLLFDKPPDADIYVLECFKKYWDLFYTWKKPNPKAKVISLIHSSLPCAPARNSDVVITQTNYSRKVITDNFPPEKIRIIPAGVDAAQGTPDYNARTFGRIVRNAPGKFHKKWNLAARYILNVVQGSRLILFTQNREGVLEHEQVEIDDSLPGDILFEDKIKALQRLSVAVFANGDFEEVFPMAVLECMSAGLPIVYLYQPSMYEMIGDSQICCGSIDELAEETKRLLIDAYRKSKIGMLARERARYFSQGKMIAAWDALIEELA